MRTPSYHNGFARSASESRYPQLWNGCVGAWCPSLGPTGVTLRDWSGRAHHGALTLDSVSNDWVLADGGYTIHFNGEYADIGTHADYKFGTGDFSLAFWGLKISTVSGLQIAFGKDESGTRQWTCGTGVTDGSTNKFGFQSFVSGGGGLLGTTTITTNIWRHFSVTRSGTTLTVFVNGASEGTTTDSSNYSLDSDLRLGGRKFAGFENGWVGYLDDFRIYRRALTQAEILMLAQRRGISFEPRERRRVRSEARVFSVPNMVGNCHGGVLGGMVG